MTVHKTIVLLVSLLVSQALYAQDHILRADSVLKIIEELQVRKDSYYDSGLFRSQRILGKDKVYEDNNFFYATLIATTLESLSPLLKSADSMRISDIKEKVKGNVFRYASRRGRATYNFWQTTPDIPNPGGPAKFQTDKYRIPDDFDDSSMIGLLLADDSISKAIRKEMVRYTRERPKKIRTTYKDYKHTDAYAVWFADKWEQELDIAVLCNTLLFVFESDFELNAYDSASILVIKHIVRDKLSRKNPYLIAPFYPDKVVILYHLARLLAADRRGAFTDIREDVLRLIHVELEAPKYELHKVMLASSLLKMGSKAAVSLNDELLQDEINQFQMFSASLMSAFGSKRLMRSIFKTSRIIRASFWKCSAYNWTLVYEYLVLKNAYAESSNRDLPSQISDRLSGD